MYFGYSFFMKLLNYLYLYIKYLFMEKLSFDQSFKGNKISVY